MSEALPRLLLVEDEEAHAELLRRAFEDQAEVAVAHSLAAARGLLEAGQRPFDLVLTDLRLPDGLGTSLLEAEAVEIPVVIMTSQGDERAAVEAIKRGAYDYVVKSVVAFEEMPRTAARVLREWRHAREKEELRQALAERERLAGIGTAAAMLAHEIGNPLNSMALAAKVMERRLAKLEVDASSVTEILAMCQRELARLATLLAEFRQLSRQRDLVLEPLEVASLFSRVCEVQGPAFEAGRLEVVLDLPDEPLVVLANGDKMTQVIVNLCNNALEAMPEGGRVVLSAEPGEDTVTLTVTDDGPGLPEGVDVFAPFTSTKEEGTGLGLAIVAQILAAHGGLASHERPESGGACFRLQLRRAPGRSGC